MLSRASIRIAANLVFIGLAASPMGAWGQLPVISAVVDAASYAPTLGEPEGIVTIFGTNLATTTATAQTLPLLTQLGGTTVTWNGLAAPLLYVSPTQINLEVPGTPPYTVVAVTTAAGVSAPYNPSTATPAASGWGLFSADSSGCGQAVALNLAPDGSASVNSSSNSASPGQWISVWGTGAFAIIQAALPPPGAATALSPVYNDIEAVPVFDFGSASYTPSQYWSGFAPGLVGVNQYNVQIPASVREGCAVPVQLVSYPGSPMLPVSQPVTLAIRDGAGPCVDPPAAGYGQAVWQKNVNTTAAGAVTETDSITVSLQSSPGMQAPASPVYTDGEQASVVTLSGPSCRVPGYRSLAAGTVTAQGPGLSPTQAPAAPFPLGQVGGLSAYQGTFPAGTALQTGAYTVSASGGADVGPFQASAQLPADIRIQTSLAGAPILANCVPLTVDWTGGDPNSWVTLRFFWGVGESISSGAFGEYQNFQIFSEVVRTSDGTATFYPVYVGVGPTEECAAPGGFPGVISIEVDPDPSEIATFSAPGLKLGGQATWKYVHTFQASAPGN